MNVYLVSPNLFFHSANALDLHFGQIPVLAAGDTWQRQPLHARVCVLVKTADVNSASHD